MMDIKSEMKIHIIHVAGTRMIEQGTYALSRGNMSEGVMLHQNMGKFVPQHEESITSQPKLLLWIQLWWGKGKSKLCLQPGGLREVVV